MFHLSSNANIRTEVPGEQSRLLLKRQGEIEGNIVSYPRKMPIGVKRAKGAIIEDVDGNQFIDFFAGCGVLNVGHSNEYVLNYVREQQDQLVHMLDFPTVNKMDFIEKILGELEEDMRDQYLVNFCGPTGSDAIEAAIKLAKHKTGRQTIICFQGSYHGMTSGALSATSNVEFRRKFGALVPNIHFIPYSYCYRCQFNRTANNCKMDCAEYLKMILENPHSGVPKPAAILLEPIQGEGGTIIPKDGYLERIVEIAHAHDVIVIFDEVQCGFFRTGKFLATLNTRAVPDIITMSKGLGGVGFPISAILFKKEIQTWGPGDHIGTFRGNQVSIAAGNGAMDFIKTYDVAEHSVEAGAYLLSQLNDLAAACPFIGDVRGKGLFMGIEYVKNKETKEPFPQFVSDVRAASFQAGFLFEVGGHYHNVIRFIPPLIIGKDIIDNAMAIFRAVHDEVSLKYSDKVISLEVS